MKDMANHSPSKRQRTEGNGRVNFDSCSSKIFNDPIHGTMEFNKPCVAVIDTPQFQRLRFIKQLGLCYFVYPGASHNRFEHSLGVCHLAGEMVKLLKNRQPELKISDTDILCVQLAGLCHDLGHGPFSHTFDGKFIPLATKNDAVKKKWTHEQASCDMLDHLIKENNLMGTNGALHKHGLRENDITFIKELIYGPLEETSDDPDWPYRGRTKDKAFLYEIVSNKRTGIDVDKWDYFARDCHHLGIGNKFDHNRYMKFIRVLEVNGSWQICTRDKEMGNLYQMFYTRYTLHRCACQHQAYCAAEFMMVDALLEANEHFLFPGKEGDVKLSDCIGDMVAFSRLTDHILWEIFNEQRIELQKAQALIKRLLCRDLYVCLREKQLSSELQTALDHKIIDESELRDKLIEVSKQDGRQILDRSEFHIQIVQMDFGMKEKDPLDKMMYFSKSEPNKAKPKTEMGLLKPPRFKDNLLRVYSCSKSEALCDRIKFCMDEVMEDWNMKT